MAGDAARLVLRRARGQRAEDDEGLGMRRDRIQRVGKAAAGDILAKDMAQDDGPAAIE